MTVETRPIVEPKVKTTADVLRHAALIIEERGWCPADLFEDETGRVCMVGAVAIASGRPAFGGFDTEARAFLARYFHDRLIPSPITYNDAPGRTATEVTAALRDAADAWERDR